MKKLLILATLVFTQLNADQQVTQTSGTIAGTFYITSDVQLTGPLTIAKDARLEIRNGGTLTSNYEIVNQGTFVIKDGIFKTEEQSSFTNENLLLINPPTDNDNPQDFVERLRVENSNLHTPNFNLADIFIKNFNSTGTIIVYANNTELRKLEEAQQKIEAEAKKLVEELARASQSAKNQDSSSVKSIEPEKAASILDQIKLFLGLSREEKKNFVLEHKIACGITGGVITLGAIALLYHFLHRKA